MNLIFSKNKSYNYLFLYLIYIFHLIKSNDFTCNKTHPILKDNICMLTYCTEEEFNSLECTINNKIIKTQWLNSIIPISDINYRFINSFLTNNNDLIIQTTNVLGTPERKYFGLTKEGRYFFNNSNGDEYPYFSINAIGNDNDELYKFEGIAASIQIKNEPNDYFLSIGNYDAYAEIIDYRNKIITRKLSKDFYYVPIISEISSIFLMEKLPYDSNDSNKYYIISFLTDYQGIYYFMCKIYYFNSTDISNGYERVANRNTPSAKRKITSCFQSPITSYIFCFYQNDNYEFMIIIYEPKLELNEKLRKVLDTGESNDEDEYIFFKCIYLISNVGFYIYYKSISSYPYIAIKGWDGNSLINTYKNYEIFALDKYRLNANYLYNDIIRIKIYQICFSSISQDKDILYIIIFNFFNDYNKLMIRYYTIQLYELYHKKFLLDLKLNRFGDYISLSSSLCSNYNCGSNSEELIVI